MKIKLSKSQWEEMGKKAGWITAAPALQKMKGSPALPIAKNPPTAFQAPDARKINQNPLTQNDAQTRKEVSDYLRWLGPKVQDENLKKMIQQDQGAKKGVLEFTEALTNVPIAKTKEIVQKTEDVKTTIEEEQSQSTDDQGKVGHESVGKK